MKVAFVANSAWYLHNFRRSTLEEFAQHGRCVCISPRSENNGELDCLDVDRRYIRLDATGSNVIKEFIGLASLFFELLINRPGMVFSFNPKTNLYSLISCWLLRIPCAPNVSGAGVASQLEGLKGGVYRVLTKFFFRRAACVFFQNKEDLRDYVSRGCVLPDNAHIVPGSGVDLAQFFPKQKNHGNIRFLLAARLIKQKGVMEYLEAARRLSGNVVGCEFLLAGVRDKSTRAIDDSVIDTLGKEGIVTFLGHVEDMPKLLDDVDCVVLPSYYPEGIPRSLIEAAAGGKIIITTDMPGCREVVEGNGFLVAPGSVQELEQAIRVVAGLDESEQAALKLASRALAEKRFDERLVIESYLKVARRIAGLPTDKA